MKYELRLMLAGYFVGAGVCGFAYSGKIFWLGLAIASYFGSYLIERRQ